MLRDGLFCLRILAIPDELHVPHVTREQNGFSSASAKRKILCRPLSALWLRTYWKFAVNLSTRCRVSRSSRCLTNTTHSLAVRHMPMRRPVAEIFTSTGGMGMGEPVMR